MEEDDLVIRHFERMKNLASALGELPARIEAHWYHPRTFGSWAVVVRYRGKRVKVVFDGRECDYELLSKDVWWKPPFRWWFRSWQIGLRSKKEVQVAKIVRAIVECANAG